jgi:hypothetical protein
MATGGADANDTWLRPIIEKAFKKRGFKNFKELRDYLEDFGVESTTIDGSLNYICDSFIEFKGGAKRPPSPPDSVRAGKQGLHTEPNISILGEFRNSQEADDDQVRSC